MIYPRHIDIVEHLRELLRWTLLCLCADSTSMALTYAVMGQVADVGRKRRATCGGSSGDIELKRRQTELKKEMDES